MSKWRQGQVDTEAWLDRLFFDLNESILNVFQRYFADHSQIFLKKDLPLSDDKKVYWAVKPVRVLLTLGTEELYFLKTFSEA